jgi:hypothetical protein
MNKIIDYFIVIFFVAWLVWGAVLAILTLMHMTVCMS